MSDFKAMAIRLSEKYLRQISACVSEIDLNDWVSVFDSPTYDALVKSVKGIHHEYLTEQDVNYFLTDILITFVFDVKRERTGRLSEPENADMHAVLIATIRDAIESLPWNIQVRFPLPRFVGFDRLDLKISDSISLKENPMETVRGGDKLNELLKISPKRNFPWLCVDVRGYGTADPDTGAISNAITQAKQCLYFLKMFGFNSPREGETTPDTYAVLPSEFKPIRLPNTLARHFGMIAPLRDRLTIYDTGGAPNLLAGKIRPAENAPERTLALEQNLHTAREYFRRKDHRDFGAIGAAIEWFIDSVTADNQTFAYIAACIGLEALLGYGEGSERMEDMTSRLSDRYGFLLGAGRSEREELSKEYLRILSLRGKLVHARSKRLTSAEQMSLGRVQGMLSDVINKEISIFSKLKISP